MHVDEGTIHAWLDGELPAEEGAALESHVATCTSCAAAVAEARGLMAASSRILGALDEVPAEVIPRVAKAPVDAPRRAARRWWQRPQFAAAAGLVVMAVWSTVVYRGVGGSSALEQAPATTFVDTAMPPERETTPAVAAAPLERVRAADATAAKAAPKRDFASADAATTAVGSTVAKSAEADVRQEQVAGSLAGGLADSARMNAVASPPPVRAAVAVDSLVANEQRRVANEVSAQRSVPAAAPPAESRRIRQLSQVVGASAPRCFVIARSLETERLGVPARIQLLDAAGPTVAGSAWRQVRANGLTGIWFWRSGPDRVEIARVVSGAVGEVYVLTEEGRAVQSSCP